MGEHKEYAPLEKFQKGETLWDVISSILRHTWVTFLHRHNVRTSSKLFTVNKVADRKSELFPPPHENPFNGSFWYFLSIWLPNVIALFYFYKTTWLCFLAKNPAPSYFFRKTLTFPLDTGAGFGAGGEGSGTYACGGGWYEWSAAIGCSWDMRRWVWICLTSNNAKEGLTAESRCQKL